MYCIQVQHEGILFSCDRCEFKAKKKLLVKRHMKAKHADGVFHCGQCSFKADGQFGLRQHVEAEHGGGSYSCGRGDYKGICFSNTPHAIHYGVKREVAHHHQHAPPPLPQPPARGR